MKELFVDNYVAESYKLTKRDKRRTLQYKDLGTLLLIILLEGYLISYSIRYSKVCNYERCL